MPNYGRNRDDDINDRKARESREQNPVGFPLTEDDINFYFEQVVLVHDFGANATLEAIQQRIGPSADRHLRQLQAGLDMLVERGRLEFKEVDRRPANMTGTEMAYVPATIDKG